MIGLSSVSSFLSILSFLFSHVLGHVFENPLNPYTVKDILFFQKIQGSNEYSLVYESEESFHNVISHMNTMLTEPNFDILITKKQEELFKKFL